jgi:heme/copper-type cytochrome/quinol oxidase subunit 3
MADIHLSEISLPVGGQEQISTRWWGMMCLIATEGILFVYLIFAYAYLGSQSPGTWPPTGPPSLYLSAPDTIVLIVSSFLLGWGVRNGVNKARLQFAIAGTFILGAVFLVVQGFEWAAKPFMLKTNAYSAIYFTLTGFHMAHVVVGLLLLLVLLGWSFTGRLNHHPECAALGALYWHFVDVVWLAVFTAIYLVPRFS